MTIYHNSDKTVRGIKKVRYESPPHLVLAGGRVGIYADGFLYKTAINRKAQGVTSLAVGSVHTDRP